MGSIRPPAHSSTVTGPNAHARSQGVRLTAAERVKAQEGFLEQFRKTGIITAACEAMRISRETVKRWRKSRAFEEQFQEAQTIAAEILETEAWRRGMQGVTKPAISNGQIVYEYEPLLDERGQPRFDGNGKQMFKRGKRVEIREYDSGLLKMLLEHNHPKYRKSQDINISGNVLPPVVTISLATAQPPEPEEPPSYDEDGAAIPAPGAIESADDWDDEDEG